MQKRLEKMGYTPTKAAELLSNSTINTNLTAILNQTQSNNKLLAVQAQYNSSPDLTRLIADGLVQNEKAIKRVIELNYEDAVLLIKSSELSESEIRGFVGSDFKTTMKVLNEKCCFMEMKKVIEIVKDEIQRKEEENNMNNGIQRKEEKISINKGIQIKEKKNNMCNGIRIKEEEIDKANINNGIKIKRKNQTNNYKQNTNEALTKISLERGELSKINITEKRIARFPPEPNGFLHIGHAKALSVNFSYTDEVFLRFDDTNPKNEHLNFYTQIIEDVEWLGVKPKYVTASSDYFERMIEMGRQLIREGKAYVCHLSADDIKKYRRECFVAGNGDRKHNVSEYFVRSGHPLCCCNQKVDVNNNLECKIHLKRAEKTNSEFVLSPFRNRPVEVSLVLFEEMVEGKWKEGKATLRMKMDAESKDPFMHDLIAFRVIDTPHSITGNAFHVYPSYDFALCVSDSIEEVTYSFCTREFMARQGSYNWLLDALSLYKPVQWEFSRLCIEDALLSKRRINALMESGVIKTYDDPRLFTLCGLRRRGVMPKSIFKFVEKVGVSFTEGVASIKLFNSIIRDDLNKETKRICCVIKPIKLIIEDEDVIYISGDDYCDSPGPNFLRLSPQNAVGLFGRYSVEFVRREGSDIIVKKSTKKPLKFIHWVENLSYAVELRMYSSLIKNGVVDENSLSVVTGYCEKSIEEFEVEERVQLVRIGYFCVDKESCENKVLNLTIGLKGNH